MNKKEIFVVSGLPRSGTSLMMKMLDKASFPLRIDGLREADQSNPGGYYEYEKVKTLPKEIDWIEDCRGHFVKIIANFLFNLPKNYVYNIIFMRRNLQEIISSQNRMIDKLNSNVKRIGNEKLLSIYSILLENSEKLMNSNANMSWIPVNYNNLLTNPKSELLPLTDFLSTDFSVREMVDVINPELYRERHNSNE